jgi:hypothetical protein
VDVARGVTVVGQACFSSAVEALACSASRKLSVLNLLALLVQKALACSASRKLSALNVLALLVQKYKY